jgi:phosphopantothenoylcysteine decarboxylase/phosphopantothenate--cysteine ligase
MTRSSDTAAAQYDVSALSGKRLLLLATGALGTAFLPSWIGWIKQTVPDIDLQVALTPTALDFVGAKAVHGFLGAPALVDSWEASGGRSIHVEVGEWADGFLIHPASMSFVARLSAGLCDSPLMLAIQGTLKPVVVAASAPPGFVKTPVWRGYQEAFKARENVELLAPMEGESAHASSLVGSPATIFPIAAARLSSALERHK